jgi:hypothetical protein
MPQSLRYGYTVKDVQTVYGMYCHAMTQFTTLCLAGDKSANTILRFVQFAQDELAAMLLVDGWIGGSDPFSSLSFYGFDCSVR